MKAEITDRRIGRTRRLLHKALIDLILEKGYDTITVQDILDRADVGRSTFYAHYRDKEDLLLSGFDQVFQSFRAQFNFQAGGTISEESGRQHSLMIFRHAAGHREIFKAMFGGQGVEVVMRYARKYLSQTVRSFFREILNDRKLTIPEDILVHYAVNSFLSMLTWWLDEGASIQPEEMNSIFWDLAVPGIRNVINS